MKPNLKQIAAICSVAMAAYLVAPPLSPAASATIDPAADTLLHHVADAYKNAQNWKAYLEIRHHVEMPGERQDMATSAALTLARPNKLALHGQGEMLGGIYLDGRQLTLVANQFKQYRLLEQPSLDDLRDNQEVAGLSAGSLGAILPLLDKDPYSALIKDVKAIRVDGQESIDGVACTRLVFDEKPVAMKIWITNADPARILKFQPDVQAMADQQPDQSGTLKNAKITSTISLRNQQFDTDVAAADFKPAIPDGFARVQKLGPQEANANDEQSTIPLVGNPAPPLKLKTLDGGQFDLADYKGKNIVVLDFWATWCGPCREAMPMIIKATGAYKDKGVVYYSVDEGEDADVIKKFLQHQNFKMNIALDSDGEAGKPFQFEGIPYTVIIDKQGIVRKFLLGVHDDEDKILSQVFDDLLAGRPIAPDPPEK